MLNKLKNKLSITENRFDIVKLFFISFIIISLITRVVLLFYSWQQISINFLELISLFTVGFFMDIITAGYMSIPLIIYCLIIPNRLYQNRFHVVFLYLIFFATMYIILFSSLSEWFFWGEFSSRFNFIAVDYLVYTSEIIASIRESYPVNTLLVVILFITISVLLVIRQTIKSSTKTSMPILNRLRVSASFLLIPILGYLFIEPSITNVSNNRYVNELANNGIYSFFSAFRSNKLDYMTYYKTLPKEQVRKNLKILLSQNNVSFNSKQNYIKRQISPKQPEIHPNIVMITVESLSAKYLSAFGNNQNLTPNLDKIINDSILYTNLYATGTRTIRGLEALTLSVPPTPGRSIVKRPNNENLFSSGSLFKEHGYTTKFIYGGYGYFDNMNYFFGHNGFEVIDRRDIDDKDVLFSNAWGISDEDLFTKALTEMNKDYKKGKPFFHMLMTTSNHRPFTYPEGRIDIKSGLNREGAVKYTDYAINDFISRSKKMPWFNNTIFVIVADHCASSAGEAELQFNKYKIPLILYSPALLSPKKIKTLASQIDVIPTLLGLLHFQYTSQFFGHDIADINKNQQRALIGNYQKLGYLKNTILTILTPLLGSHQYKVNFKNESISRIPEQKEILNETISYYQGASMAFYEHTE